MTRVGLDIGDVLHQRDDFLHAREINLRINPLAVQVHASGNQIHVAGTLAIAQQGAFHTVCPGHHCHLGGGHTTTTVVVSVHADDHIIPVLDIFVDQLHLVCEHIGGAHFHGGRQVDDHPLALIRAPHSVHCIDHFDGEVGLGGAEGFRGILEAPVGLRLLCGIVAHPFGGTLGNGFAAGLVHIEHLLAERGRGGIVDMNDGVLRSLE